MAEAARLLGTTLRRPSKSPPVAQVTRTGSVWGDGSCFLERERRAHRRWALAAVLGLEPVSSGSRLVDRIFVLPPPGGVSGDFSVLCLVYLSSEMAELGMELMDFLLYTFLQARKSNNVEGTVMSKTRRWVRRSKA